jgi:hypothetical protein
VSIGSVDAPIPPRRALRTLLLALPAVLLLVWLAAVTWHASVVVDQVRYFYLDDDQMISMRYARNLVDGQGLVWNPGERVEGYSNPGWVLVMAAVHAAGASPAKAALFVKALGAVAALGILLAARRLARIVGPVSLAGEFVLLTALALCADVVYWAANGFETTLLTALFVWLLARAMSESLNDGRPSASTMIATGYLAIVRSDAHLLVLAILIVGIATSADWRKSLRRAALALVFPVVHLLGRAVYYGDTLPNTFYLRYHDVAGVWLEGARYVRNLLFVYGPLIAAACVSALTATTRLRFWLLVPLIGAGLHALVSGGDMYEHFRFFAPTVPVLLVLVVTGLESWTYSARFRRLGLAATLALAVVAGQMVRPWPVEALRSWRGKPWQGTVQGLLLDRYSSPQATVAAVDVGALGYFSGRKLIDLTGRTDATIARTPGRAGADPAWRKFDIEHSLAARPDFVVTSAPHEAAQLGEGMFALQGVDTGTQVIPALVSSRTFLRLYRDTPVPLEPLLDRNAVYIRAESPERKRLESWRMPDARF